MISRPSVRILCIVGSGILLAGLVLWTMANFGPNAILRAAKAGNLARVRSLIAKGADLNVQDPRTGWAPIHLAASCGHKEVVGALLEAGVALESRSSGGLTPLFVAALHAQNGVVRFLLSKGAQVNVRDSVGRTPLLAVVLRISSAGKLAMARLLLANGADVNAAIHGVTPLRLAVSFGDAGLIRLLLSHGANVNAVEDGGLTPLWFAACRGDVAVLRLLLDAGADVHLRTVSGDTALMAASIHGHTGAVRLLLERGADPKARNVQGETALSEVEGVDAPWKREMMVLLQEHD